jgi:hypothetical protein
MPRLNEDHIAPQMQPIDIELAQTRALLEQAAGRVHIAIGQLQPAWRNLAAGAPGYQGTTTLQTDDEAYIDKSTHPESYAAILDDPAVAALEQLRRATRALVDHATTIYRVATEWATGDTPPAGPVKVDLELWCTSCLRAGVCAPIFRGELCRWCYDFNAVEKQRPPVALVRLHHQPGVRITQRIVNDALGRKPKKRRR